MLDALRLDGSAPGRTATNALIPFTNAQWVEHFRANPNPNYCPNCAHSRYAHRNGFLCMTPGCGCRSTGEPEAT